MQKEKFIDHHTRFKKKIDFAIELFHYNFTIYILLKSYKPNAVLPN